MAFWKKIMAKCKRIIAVCKKKQDAQTKTPMIFPLSPNAELDNNKLSGFEVYKDYLTTAFQQKRIQNIVLTGDFGIGKSSVIRSIERECCKEDKGFLYVSLADYQNRVINQNSKVTYRKKKRPCFKRTDKEQQSILERRILLQIYAGLREKDLPERSFHMVQEHHGWWRLFYSLVGCVAVVITLLLFFLEKILNIVTEALQHNWESTNANADVFTTIEKFEEISSDVAFGGSIARGVMCFILLVIVGVFAYRFISYAFSRWKIRALNIKLDSLQAVCEQNACETYLDQHTTEIIYCLERIAKKVSYTVVFEDLDRLDKKSCLNILTRLREINRLINLRMIKNKKQPIRFVYVVNNRIVSCLEWSKFADYVMPIIPKLNEMTAEKILAENVGKVNEELKDEFGIDILVNDVVQVIAPYLSDYRMQYTVLNEYSLLFRLYCQSHSPENACKVARNILAMAVYKNYFPEDYSKIRDGKSGAFPVYNPAKFSNNKYQGLLAGLVEGDSPLLEIECLHYAGYSASDMLEMYVNKLIKNLPGTLAVVDLSKNGMFHEALHTYCDKFALVLGNDATIRLLIRYLIEHESNDWEWLFNQDVWALKVLKILSDDEFDDDMIMKLFSLAGLDIEGDTSIFDKCKETHWNNEVISGTNSLCTARSLSKREYEVLRLGLGEKYTTDFFVYVDGLPNKMPIKRVVTYDV